MEDYISKNKVLTGVVITLLVLFTILGGLYLYTISKKQGGTPSSATTTTADNSCGALTAENNSAEGPAPLKVLLKGKISGTVSSTKPVCQWSIDGAKLYDSYPVNGFCVFGKDPIATKGEHTVSYKIDGKTCSASKKVIVR